MDAWEEDRLRRFQQLVDLDALPSPHSPEVGVVADWRTKLDRAVVDWRAKLDPSVVDWRERLAPSVEKWTLPGWDLFFRHVRAESGETLGEWALRRGSEQLAVKIFVSSHGVQPARLYFRRLAMSSTAPEYPYQPIVSGDPEVVTFYVASPSLDGKTNNDSVLQLFRNVVFDVRVYDSSISVLDVAKDLLSFAREHADAQLLQHLPSVEQLPEVALPEVHVQVPVAPDPLDRFHDTDFDVKVKTEGQAEFLGFAERNAKFRWERHPEDGRIKVHVIDRRTLLSQTLRIPVRSIQPSGPEPTPTPSTEDPVAAARRPGRRPKATR